MITLTVNGNTVRALGPIKLNYQRDGSMMLKLGASYSTSVKIFDTIELYNGTVRLFSGRVHGTLFSEAGGIIGIEAWDWKNWLKEIPYFGRSQQCGATRNARVKYAYTSTESLPKLPIWTVGEIIQDIINNASDEISTDGLPTLWDVLPSTLKSLWQNDYTNWLSDFATFHKAFSTDNPTEFAANTSAWKNLTLEPFGHQFDGASIAEAISRILGKYYPSYGWWIDPTNVSPYPKPFDTYSENAKVYNIDTYGGLYLDNVTPIVNNCFTRVIVEGKSVTKVSMENILTGFVDSDLPAKTGGGYQQYECATDQLGNYYIVTAQYIRSNYNTEDYRAGYNKQIVASVLDNNNQCPKSPWGRVNLPDFGSSYGKDSRWRYDTGFGGDAYSDYGIKRTLVVIDDTVGDAVVTTDASGNPTFVDRSTEGQTLAAGIWNMLKATRWTGSLLVPNSAGQINPLQRVKILNHPKFGDITFMPASAEWDVITGELRYSLGDSRRNPIGELQLQNQINWRDRLNQRKREPLNVTGI